MVIYDHTRRGDAIKSVLKYFRRFLCEKPIRSLHISYIFLKSNTSIHPAEEGMCFVRVTLLVFDQKVDWDIICLFKTVSYQSGVAWLGAGEDP